MSAQPANAVSFKLGDLGIAKVFTDINGQHTLLNNRIHPPELIEPAQFGALDQRVDVYQCGLLLLGVHYGRELVFTPAEAIAGAPRALAEQLPAPVGPALARALRRHVKDRTPTALEIWRDLNGL